MYAEDGGFVTMFFECSIGNVNEVRNASVWGFAIAVLDLTGEEGNGFLKSIPFIMIKKGFMDEILRKVRLG